jgi:DNA primase
LHLGATRPVPAVQEDFHGIAHLGAAVWPVHLLLSAAGLGIELPVQRLGAIRPSLQGSQSIAGSSNASPVDLPEAGEPLLLGQDRARHYSIVRLIHCTYHPCLGLRGCLPYSASGGKIAMKSLAAETLKEQIPLRDYVEGQGWKPVLRITRGRLMGLCPLHADHKPSFLLDPNSNLFYCYGCGRGGDVIRFAELYFGVSFRAAIAVLRRWYGMDSLLGDVARFYQVQLHRHPKAVAYLEQRGLHRPQLIEELRIGYAPGRCLCAWLMSLGYPLESIQQAGVITRDGFDTLTHRIVFPLEGNLYGRSIGNAAPHRFLPGGKGGLYGWEKVRACPEIILVEGLFDLAVLRQAGFPNVTCSIGTYLNRTQMQQLCDGATRTVYVVFDSDRNGCGQRAARQLTQRLWTHRLTAFPVDLPEGHDPNSFFVHGGGDALQFQALLDRARS